MYQNCFIGIKVNPVSYPTLNSAYNVINEKIPSVKLIPQETSHITLYFLDDRSEDELREIIPLIKNVLIKDQAIKTINIKTSNADYFDLIKHLVLIYHIEMNAELRDIYELMKNTLSHIKKTRVSFIPHLTLGRIYDEDSKLLFYADKHKLYKELDQISLTFKTTEILLIGRDADTRVITPIESFSLD